MSKAVIAVLVCLVFAAIVFWSQNRSHPDVTVVKTALDVEVELNTDSLPLQSPMKANPAFPEQYTEFLKTEPVWNGEAVVCDASTPEFLWHEIHLELQVGANSSAFTTFGEADGAKNICDPPPQAQDLIISLGSFNDWSFEELVGQQTTKIHTFDCTIYPNEKKPSYVKFYHQCLGKSYGYSFQQLAKDVGITKSDRVFLKMDIETFEFDLIEDIVSSELAPEILMVEIHFSTFQNCERLRRARWWAKTIGQRYTLCNWRYNHLCPQCVETTYSRKTSTAAAASQSSNIANVCPAPRLQFRVLNSNLLSTLTQLVYFTTYASSLQKPYCLQNTLLNPDVFHMEDFSWILPLFDLCSCDRCKGVSDEQLIWNPKLHDPPFDIRAFQLFFDYPSLSAQFFRHVISSPENKRLSHCLLVDGTVNPGMNDWVGQEVSILLSPGTTSPVLQSLTVCSANTCIIQQHASGFVFINLLSCKHVLLPDTPYSQLIQTLRMRK